MTDYTVNTDFSAKDALPVDDPEKLILGADLDAEFDEIATAIASKYDSGNIATQVQAEAGTSNTVLMTPLRVQQALGSNGGLVADIQALTDPGADRILFWDDSVGAAGFLTAGTGLTLSGTTLTTDDANINHDSLTGFVADEHVAHSGVTLTAGEGLSGGGTIAASRSFALDVNGLTQETTLDLANDVAVFYDASATAHRKVPLENFVGSALGDGRFYRSSNQALSASTPATVVFNATDYNELERGTFSTATGLYTAGSAGARVLVTAALKIDQMPAVSSIILYIRKNGTTNVASVDTVLADASGAEDRQITIAVPLSLASGDTIEVYASPSNNAMTIEGTVQTFIGIVELG